MLIKTLDSFGIRTLEGKFRVVKPVTGGMGAHSFEGEDLETRDKVFIKFLLFPRNEMELAKFQNEIDALQHLGRHAIQTTPQYLTSGQLFDGNIRYFITTWADGITLRDWIARELETSSIEQRLEVFHRVACAISYNTLYSHRDLHPGNVILSYSSPNWVEFRLPNPTTIIVDWGESFSGLVAGFHDAPEYATLLASRIPKQISGSFYCLPPEIFSPWSLGQHVAGNYDSWALGLLLYKFLTLKDLFAFPDIGSYAQASVSGNIATQLTHAYNELSILEFENAKLLAALMSRLVEIDPKNRAPASWAGRVMFDMRIEEIKFHSESELLAYIRDPHNFKPERGWRYSDWPDYD
ncbi:protein kinase domain-containing protein [Burkholderia diffusa]|uniref:protein kinase domain-containing protein n=1 Tax=Burkholderia diffusa TaxID=488732 RepID=UPI002AB2F03B|nr:protein kinase [Burkholderia diffusa]